jgi:transcriptional regulator GlxA family with amidase domain
MNAVTETAAAEPVSGVEIFVPLAKLKKSPRNARKVPHGEALSLHIAQRYGGLQPPQRQPAGGLAPWQLRLATNAIEENLDGSIVLEDLAFKCGLSTSHFSRAFAKSTGLAPHRWITRRRVDVAKDMISSASMPLAQVAVACGFSDQSHFTRMFAALNGVTPGRWRATQEHLEPGL